MSRLLLYRLKNYSYVPKVCVCKKSHETFSLVENPVKVTVCFYHINCAANFLAAYHNRAPFYAYIYLEQCGLLGIADGYLDITNVMKDSLGTC